MSYIPKYILKRMFPNDAFKAVEGGIEMTAVNVISPISIDEMPDDVLNYVELLIDGQALSKDIMAKTKITVENKTYTIENAKEFVGQTIPVGGTIKVFCPVTNIKAGEEHEMKLTIKLDNPFQIEVKRTVQ